ncbi:50S ribosomal protein L17 [Candidatus Daviesbacteria bacterium]|nr:50S ribosomal protein L17 [Candidatus Daviesbacteria bacterium]
MRHKVYGKHLGRDKNERAALFKNLVGSLILHGSIQVSEAKAKAIKGLVDKIINQAKTPNTRRLLQTFLTSKKIQEKLIQEVIPVLKSRTSGYTSLVKLGPRQGDGAMMVRMSLLKK